MSVDRAGSETSPAAGEPPNSGSNPGAASLKPNRILDAIARIAANLITAPSLDTALPAALQGIGEAIAADRVGRHTFAQ